MTFTILTVNKYNNQSESSIPLHLKPPLMSVWSNSHHTVNQEWNDTRPVVHHLHRWCHFLLRGQKVTEFLLILLFSESHTFQPYLRIHVRRRSRRAGAISTRDPADRSGVCGLKKVSWLLHDSRNTIYPTDHGITRKTLWIRSGYSCHSTMERTGQLQRRE